MNELVNMIFVEGDVIHTAVKLFVFGFSLEFVLGFANIIKTSYSSIRR